MNVAFCKSVVRSSMVTTVGRRAICARTVSTAKTPSSLLSSRSPTFSFVPGHMTTERFFSEESTAKKECIAGNSELSSPKLQGLYDRVVVLPEEDVNVLGAMVLQILGRTIFPGQFGTPGGNMEGVGDGVGATEGAEEVEEEKTAFDVKLVGFNAKSKIKVIKEVRAVAGLGLKEAKELVESAPKVIQKDLKKEAADELKEKLEALGAEIEIV